MKTKTKNTKDSTKNSINILHFFSGNTKIIKTTKTTERKQKANIALPILSYTTHHSTTENYFFQIATAQTTTNM